MTMNPLPPQAYTKETLLKAYHWLQQQPPAIKEMAMTPDLMVSLFLKASREGDSVLERPSIQNFKSELRSLAGLMGELEGPKPEKPPEPPPRAAEPAPRPAAAPSPVAAAAPPAAPAPAFAAGPHLFDEQTSAMLRETRLRFNLGSDGEALRMLVKIGHEKAMAFFGEPK